MFGAAPATRRVATGFGSNALLTQGDICCPAPLERGVPRQVSEPLCDSMPLAPQGGELAANSSRPDLRPSLRDRAGRGDMGSQLKAIHTVSEERRPLLVKTAVATFWRQVAPGELHNLPGRTGRRGRLLWHGAGPPLTLQRAGRRRQRVHCTRPRGSHPHSAWKQCGVVQSTAWVHPATCGTWSGSWPPEGAGPRMAVRPHAFA